MQHQMVPVRILEKSEVADAGVDDLPVELHALRLELGPRRRHVGNADRDPREVGRELLTGARRVEDVECHLPERELEVVLALGLDRQPERLVVEALRPWDVRRQHGERDVAGLELQPVLVGRVRIQRQAEKLPVELLGLFDVFDGDADVVDALDVNPSRSLFFIHVLLPGCWVRRSHAQSARDLYAAPPSRRLAHYPTDPSICSWISRFISTAYSSGSSFVIGSTKPLTISADASASESPRDIR